MARIPDGSGFGNAGPVRPQGGAARNPGTAGLDALGGLARQIGGMAQQQLQKARADDDALARAKASNALLDHELAIQARADDVASRVSTGELDYREADSFYQAEVEKIKAPDFTNLDPVLAEQVRGGLTRNAVSGRTTIARVTGAAKRADFRSQFATALDSLGKLAAAPDADIDAINGKARAFRALALQAELPPDQVDKALQDFSDKNWTNHATQRYINGRDDVESLTQLETDLTAEDGFYAARLDTDKRNALLSQVMGGRTRLEAKAGVDADRREAVAEREVTWFRDQLVTGVEITGERWQEGIANVQGTAQEGAFQQARAMASEIQQFRSQPFADQEAYLRALESRTKTTPSDDPKRDLSRLSTLRSAFDAAKKQAQESPLSFVQNQTGIVVPPLDIQSLAGGDPGLVAAQLQSRFAILGSLRKSYGEDVARNPWLPEEAAMVRSFFSQADDRARLSFLSVLSGTTPDAQSYASALKPIAADEPLFMAAGLAQFRKLKGADGSDVPTLILAGARIRADKSVPQPGDRELRRAFDERVGEALPDGSPARQKAFDVFAAVYAGRAQSTGVRHEDAGGTIEADRKVADAAIEMATGGVTEINDVRVLRPYGMDEQQFEDRLGRGVRAAAEASGLEASVLDDLPVMPVPGDEGAYHLVNDGAIQVDPKTRKPIVVRVQ
ncbi:hypothetical protein [Arenimonas alkanexedens]